MYNNKKMFFRNKRVFNNINQIAALINVVQWGTNLNDINQIAAPP